MSLLQGARGLGAEPPGMAQGAAPVGSGTFFMDLSVSLLICHERKQGKKLKL